MSKKSSSKTSSTQTATVTPSNPEWITSGVQGLQGRINGLLDTDASSLVPGASPLQQLAFGAAPGLLGSGASAPARAAAPGMDGGADPGAVRAQQMIGLGSGPAEPATPAYAAMDTFKPKSPSDGGPQVLPMEPTPTSVPAQTQDDGGLMGWRGRLGQAQDAAAGLLAPVQGAMLDPEESRGLLDMDLARYEDPYRQQVIDTTLASNDEAAGMERARLAAEQARGQKFSGSGSAIERALFERGALTDRAQLEAGLRSQGFDNATRLAMADLDRESADRRFNASQALASRAAQTQAAGLLGDLAQTGGAGDRADIGLLSDLGSQERQIDREGRGAEANLLTLISALQGQQPYGLFHGQTTNATGTSTTKSKESDPLGGAAGILGGLGSLASGLGAMGATLGPLAVISDKRLKTDIRRHGRDRAGRPMVTYRYKGEPEGVRRFGHIAQDVEKTDPQAIRRVGRYKAIDYGLLEGAEAA